MKSTRKWIAAIMAVLMLVLMAACGNGGNAANENKAGYRTLEEIKAAGRSISGYSPIRTPLAMWMRTASIRATMCTLPGGWRRIWVLTNRIRSCCI